MTPEQFIAKWQNASLKERSAAQEHFIDLCRLLGEPTPAEADPKGDWYAFEKERARRRARIAIEPLCRAGNRSLGMMGAGILGWGIGEAIFGNDGCGHDGKEESQ